MKTPRMLSTAFVGLYIVALPVEVVGIVIPVMLIKQRPHDLQAWLLLLAMAMLMVFTIGRLRLQLRLRAAARAANENDDESVSE